MQAMIQLLADQSISFVLAAGAICALSGWALYHLTDRAAGATGNSRAGWLVGTAVVAGTGVWTTHFIAMLGYRTDLVLTYDSGTTLTSVAAAVAAVGLPLAGSVLLAGSGARALAGALAGIGIGVMHITGMAALEGCIQTQSWEANMVACAVGATAMALMRGLPARWTTPTWSTILFVAGVCGTHFVSLAGTTLTGGEAVRSEAPTQVLLSVLTATGSALLLLAAFLALATAKRFDTQERTHTAVLATALQNMSNGILKISSAEIVEIYNRRLCVMLGLAEADVKTGMTLPGFLGTVGRAQGWSPNRVARVLDNHRAWMRKGAETVVEHHMIDGRIVSVSCQPVEDGAVLTYDDVTAARAAQKEISHLAYHDPLTNLPNRRALGEELRRCFACAEPFELLLIDLDRFKSVNDTFGHGVGDLLLVQVAERLRAANGPGGFVARLGGDEMAVVVPGDADRGLGVAEAIVRDVERPYEIGDCTVVIGCSIGLCRGLDATDPGEVMKRSDVALYEAKRHGRGRAVRYQDGMMEAVADRHRLEHDLRGALRFGQFHLVYQPIMALSDDRVVGSEALIRWTHPVRGLVSPASFIPIAEETGLIVPIGRWVLEEACREAARWPSDRHVAVNVSAVQFRSPTLLAHVTDALAASGLPPHRLEIELTETALVEDGRQIAHTLTALRALGVKISMDDFGTGYSSLAHLRDLPLDRIKIDRSFVAAAMRDGHSLAVVRAITQMSRDMNITTVAEGVELGAQLDLLRELGCDAVQGFLIGRPERPVSEAEAIRAAA